MIVFYGVIFEPSLFFSFFDLELTAVDFGEGVHCVENVAVKSRFNMCCDGI